MGDNDITSDITVSGGGSVSVATEELTAAVAALRRAEAELAAHLRELASIDRLHGSGLLVGAPSAAVVAERQMDDASAALAKAHAAAAQLGTALERSTVAYGLVEEGGRALAEGAAAGVAYGLPRWCARSTTCFSPRRRTRRSPTRPRRC
jgi:hypothetical protein